MGKLFSGILLDRLLLFKEINCPDPKEQLGFKKGAQTNDHILTLKTVIDKYTKKRRRVILTILAQDWSTKISKIDSKDTESNHYSLNVPLFGKQSP